MILIRSFFFLKKKKRVCAVYGGIYMLDHSVKHILIDKKTNKFSGLVDINEQQLSSTYLVTAIDYLPTKFINDDDGRWYVK